MLSAPPMPPHAQLQRWSPWGELLTTDVWGKSQQNRITDGPSIPRMPSDFRNVNGEGVHPKQENVILSHPPASGEPHRILSVPIPTSALSLRMPCAVDVTCLLGSHDVCSGLFSIRSGFSLYVSSFPTSSGP